MILWSICWCVRARIYCSGSWYENSNNSCSLITIYFISQGHLKCRSSKIANTKLLNMSPYLILMPLVINSKMSKTSHKYWLCVKPSNKHHDIKYSYWVSRKHIWWKYRCQTYTLHTLLYGPYCETTFSLRYLLHSISYFDVNKNMCLLHYSK